MYEAVHFGNLGCLDMTIITFTVIIIEFRYIKINKIIQTAYNKFHKCLM